MEPTNRLNICRQIARRTFRIPNLRPEQESAMLAVLNGRDTLVALPTGFGKSLIYQVPALILDRPTIVISPLIALMADQERALKHCGVPVVALHSRLRAAERRAAHERIKKVGASSCSRRLRRSNRQTRPTAFRSGAMMIAICKDRFPEAAWVEVDMRGLVLPFRFNAIVAWDSFDDNLDS